MSDTYSIDDLELPKAVITRVLKNALPEGTVISKDTRLAANRAATVFVNYLASVANDVAKGVNHKTINSPDVIKALEIVELDHLIEPLKEGLEGKLIAEKKQKKKDGDESKQKTEGEEEEEDDELLNDVQMVDKLNTVDSSIVEDEDEDMEKAHVE
ncbi:hypothetical protein G6F57_009808 [Rhizopus arrhizus]|uniref:DNA polymerase epsilon subunit D n=1 Tax=Rhizopus oryzae TaxID=64495 RepID=A0A9P6X2G5_RHIOR|nr:hypothetical protein G6F23_009914 [Rhizopus arrhizus]KAG0758219.1 hypothetical protein G6F24_009948 [Rhizopus arrhizus]KAG0783466.1 hypothetical protein G6F22_008674 [Rhizopus arrhizus]KAG0783992.1 hypothetical protein G6F21_010191 [Rhizopus arrhizus]KAG0805545.1 hypothetical protein G6F20_011815 [Rhizopus arrhizus]